MNEMKSVRGATKTTLDIGNSNLLFTSFNLDSNTLLSPRDSNICKLNESKFISKQDKINMENVKMNVEK